MVAMQVGAFLTTSEAVILGLAPDASHPKFKGLQKLVMEQAKDTGVLELGIQIIDLLGALEMQPVAYIYNKPKFISHNAQQWNYNIEDCCRVSGQSTVVDDAVDHLLEPKKKRKNG